MGNAAVVETLRRGENLVAVCDVDLKRAGGNWTKVPENRRFKDYRRMLDKLDKQIDAVCISTPDHMHAPITLAAMALGKHVYTQKPLTRTIGEALALQKAAAKAGVMTQMGNQGHSGEGLRLTREWVQSGMIGTVDKVDLWSNRPIWPQGGTTLPKPAPVPNTLDWKAWLGVAADRPYSPAYAPFAWRGWYDFGAGAIGDIACHLMDSAVYALNLDKAATVTVEAETSGKSKYMFPAGSTITYKFAPVGNQPQVTVVWRDGKFNNKPNKPQLPKDMEPNRRLAGNGYLMYGSKATIYGAGMHAPPPRIIPETKMRAMAKQRPPRTIPRIKGGHFKNFFDACKTEKPATSDFKVAVPLTVIALLGNLAIISGRKISFDLQKMQCNGIPSNDPLITPTYLDKMVKEYGFA